MSEEYSLIITLGPGDWKPEPGMSILPSKENENWALKVKSIDSIDETDVSVTAELVSGTAEDFEASGVTK